MMGVGAKRALGLYRSCAPRQLVAEKFVLSTLPRALTTLSSMCSRAVRALEFSPGLMMMMDNHTLASNQAAVSVSGRARIDERPANATFRVIKTTSRAGILKECYSRLDQTAGKL